MGTAQRVSTDKVFMVERFIKFCPDYSIKERLLFDFFYHVAMRNFFLLDDKDQERLLQGLKDLSRPLVAADFIHPQGALYEYFLFFNHGGASPSTLRVAKCGYPLSRKRIGLYKLFITRKVYGTCTTDRLWKQIARRLLYAHPLEVAPGKRLYKACSLQRENLREHLRKSGASMNEAEIFSALLPVDFLEIKEYQKSSLIKIREFHGNAYELCMNPSLLFAADKQTKVHGYQHGGVYGEWLDNLYEVKEIAVYDHFSSWFDGAITRFNKVKLRSRVSGSIKELVWIARPNLNATYMGLYNQSYVKHLLDVSNIVKVKSVLSSISLPVRLKIHPRTSHSEYTSGGKQNIQQLTERPETYLNKNTLALFDCLSHTLLYFCLKHRLPFVIIAVVPQNGLTPQYMELLSRLQEVDAFIDASQSKEVIAKKMSCFIAGWEQLRISKKYREIVEYVNSSVG